MTTKRPVNLDIGTMKLPITAYASILHRISGVALFFVTGLLIWLLDVSLSSPQGFEAVKGYLDGIVVKLILWASLSFLAYHFVAGIRHLVMDTGVGESLAGGQLSAKLTFVLTAVLVLLAGVWVW